MSHLPRRTKVRLVAQGAALLLVFGALPGASALADKGSLPASASQTAIEATASNSAGKQSLPDIIPQSGNSSKSGPATLYKLNASGGGCGDGIDGPKGG